jgi:cysteine desulfurase
LQSIYLDYNSTTPISPTVFKSMTPFLKVHYGNPSSAHSMGRACREAVEDGRMRVAALIGADREEIVFTSCGTESNNLAIKGTMLNRPLSYGGHMIISGFEHPAVSQPASFLEKLGFDLTVVNPGSDGVIRPADIEKAIRSETRLVSIMHSNNEIGTIQPIRQIAHVCRSCDIIIHTDASQSAGKVPLSVNDLDVDLLTIAGHKVYAPKGIGALYVREGVYLEPVIHGAGHEQGMRAGTENVPYIVGLGQACATAMEGLDDFHDRMLSMRDSLETLLMEGTGHKAIVHGKRALRLPNTLSISFPGVEGSEMLRRCPEICASTGAACHGSDVHLSSTLSAIGVHPEIARGTIRLSVGWYSDQEEIQRAASMLLDAWEVLQ